MIVRLGVIGFSEGNGHPYSWSAIFNGYEPEYMKDCDFPIISKYLAERKWPDDQIQSGRVTHIWTQYPVLSRKIARASKIDNITSTPEDMIGEVDAILLARDDAQNHAKFAAPFLDAGVPVYLDKPMALSMRDLATLQSLCKFDGQIFSCSALRYANELQLSEKQRNEIGDLHRIVGRTPKSWDKYAVHVIEPGLQMLDPADQPIRHERRYYNKDAVRLTSHWESGVETVFESLGSESKEGISLEVEGGNGKVVLEFHDSFSAFRSALLAFMRQIEDPQTDNNFGLVYRSVSLIEKGRRQ